MDQIGSRCSEFVVHRPGRCKDAISTLCGASLGEQPQGIADGVCMERLRWDVNLMR